MYHELHQIQSDVARLKTQISCIFMFMLGAPLSWFAILVYREYMDS